ncbi:hypothetical protein [Devosia sp. MC521]|uniref:hypothetical protein n=1 Tax=Devosia sp. MC521 TaxID=2759954 RepID=UPI0015FBA713|nr:hypothetical protein [Devosia sp. MC521]MBJ6986074.1 hypothetical protein [Devosia sp. MC521]QMW61444.1 hypothetical protein H4N61_10660 [Devosia sp. MC521]
MAPQNRCSSLAADHFLHLLRQNLLYAEISLPGIRSLSSLSRREDVETVRSIEAV